ncbi:MAG: hypothetical protein E7218_01195 [Anaerofustis stercorihominis]|nr:hypothetical protein [Anaerofustis stercorihominis]
MKKKILVLSLILLFFTVAVGGTLAYFNAEDEAHNVITSGGIDIDLQEWADEDMTIPYDEAHPEGFVEVMPGTKVGKVVVVENLEQPAWIRADYTITIEKDGKILDIDASELAKIVKIQEGAGWVEKDGMYYYDEAVETGAKTEPLFTVVEFDGVSMGNEYQNCTFTIDVYAEAVQAANNPEKLGWDQGKLPPVQEIK